MIMETTPAPDIELVTASYTIKEEHKARIESMARKEILNASIVMRRILDEYFAKLDASPAPNGKKPRKATA